MSCNFMLCDLVHFQSVVVFGPSISGPAFSLTVSTVVGDLVTACFSHNERSRDLCELSASNRFCVCKLLYNTTLLVMLPVAESLSAN